MRKLEREEIAEIIVSQIGELEQEIESLKNSTAPVEPDRAIGRLTRMDAIQAKEINEAVLRRAKLKRPTLSFHSRGSFCEPPANGGGEAKTFQTPERARPSGKP